MKNLHYKNAAPSLTLSGWEHKKRKWLLFCLLTLTLLIATPILFPQVLFSNKFTNGNITVYSDKNIDSSIKKVLAAAVVKIEQSDLYDSTVHFKIFLCNTRWRFYLFSFGNENAGGITHTRVTGNIFIRKCNISQNKIIPPENWVFAKSPYSLSDRPLSYFIAHEMTHRLQCFHFCSLTNNSPVWIREGYADFIAKGSEFDYAENLKLFRQGAPELSPKSGLYRYYHLLVYYLIKKKHLPIRDIIENKPSKCEVEGEMLNFKN